MRYLRYAAALAVLAASAADAAASENLRCLWDDLSSVEKTRLELAARIGEPPPTVLLRRRGEAGLAATLQGCKLSLSPRDVDRASLYLSARARESILGAELTHFGLTADIRRGVLSEIAPAERRRALAEQILALTPSTNEPTQAEAVVAETARRLAAIGPALGRASRASVAAEWATVWLLATGLERGAQPPPARR